MNGTEEENVLENEAKNTYFSAHCRTFRQAEKETRTACVDTATNVENIDIFQAHHIYSGFKYKQYPIYFFINLHKEMS